MCPSFGTHSVAHRNDRTYYCPTFFLIYIILVIDCLPILRQNERNISVSEVTKTVEFLTRFGYLPPSDRNTGNLRSESEFREAIAAMQRFGGLQPTGLIDSDTIVLMNSMRCGVPDYLATNDIHRIKRYAIQGQKWPYTSLTWSVKTEAEYESTVQIQLRKAFQIWSEASQLDFTEVSSKTSADIVVSFLSGSHGDGYPFDGEGSVLAHAFFPGEGIGGDAHFDAEERWMPAAEQQKNDGVNLFSVAAHEIGHSLGLSHSSTIGSLMFPYYQVLGDEFKLPNDDADGIRHLYGYKELKQHPTLPTLVPTTLQTSTETESEAITTKTPTQKPKTVPGKPTEATTTKPPSPRPDICNSTVDAISVIRRELFVFKGNFFWRLDNNRTLRAGYPVSIDRFWYDLPSEITKIDALYERPSDTKIVFFTGRKYWLFSANQLEPGYPKSLTNLGLPDDLEHIDAALVWGHNGKTYFFSGKQYWKFDEQEERVELDYPRSISAWRGIPTDIDAAFQWTDGNTYFFKNDKYWKFVDSKMKVEKTSPSEIGGFWFQCPSTARKNVSSSTTTIQPITEQTEPENDSAIIHRTSIWFYFINVMTVLYALMNRVSL